jgi:hypothetical protein
VTGGSRDRGGRDPSYPSLRWPVGRAIGEGVIRLILPRDDRFLGVSSRWLLSRCLLPLCRRRRLLPLCRAITSSGPAHCPAVLPPTVKPTVATPPYSRSGRSTRPQQPRTLSWGCHIKPPTGDAPTAVSRRHHLHLQRPSPSPSSLTSSAKSECPRIEIWGGGGPA